MQVSCRSEQTCRTSCSSTGRMLCHDDAPIWTGLTMKTGENCPNYRDFCSDRKFWPRTHPNLKNGPKTSCLLFLRGDLKSNFRLPGNFIPVGQIFPVNSSNRAASSAWPCGGWASFPRKSSSLLMVWCMMRTLKMPEDARSLQSMLDQDRLKSTFGFAQEAYSK